LPIELRSEPTSRTVSASFCNKRRRGAGGAGGGGSGGVTMPRDGIARVEPADG